MTTNKTRWLLVGLVTEMKLVKHPFRSGVKAQPGIEY